MRSSIAIIATAVLVAAAIQLFHRDILTRRAVPKPTSQAPAAHEPDPTPDGARRGVRPGVPVGRSARSADPSARDALPMRRSDHGAVPGVTDTGTDPPHEWLDSLDDAPVDLTRRRLSEAVARARRDRGLDIDERVVTRVVANDAARIVLAGPASRTRLESRLAGTRHGEARYLRLSPSAALEVGPQALLELIESPDVERIQIDGLSRVNLAQTIPLIGADDTRAAGFDGSGYAIAILDTGVDTSHPVFAGRVVAEACFSATGNCPNGETTMYGPGSGVPCTISAECEHGTAVAGIALGLDATRSGVAPGAGLVSIQVFSEHQGQARALDSDIAAGLEHVYFLTASHDFGAANLSLGRDGFTSPATCDANDLLVAPAVSVLRAQRVPTVAAAGNDSQPYSIRHPACLSSVVSVGATTKADEVESYSNSADFLDLLAPGSAVDSPGVGGAWVVATGTSMAAAHVSGAWAVLRQASPTSNVPEVLDALDQSGVPITDDRNSLTLPRIDVAAAVPQLDAGIHIPDDFERIAVLFDDSGCGLIGLEALVPLLLARALRRRRRGVSIHYRD